MVAGGFLNWVWLVDLLVRFVRELIERLGENANGGDPELASLEVNRVKEAAARVLDPREPDETIRV